MRLEGARLSNFRLPLRQPLRTARQRIVSRDGVLLELFSDCGQRGVGSACPMPGFGSDGLARCRATLESLTRRLLSGAAGEAGALLDRASSAAPAACAALDTALYDLRARRRGIRVADLLAESCATTPRERVELCALVVGDTPVRLAEHARALVARGFGCLKLKVGAGSLATDVQRVAALRDAVGPRPLVRLDANGAWKEGEALATLERLAAFGLELVEQPLPTSEVEGLARLRASSPVPLAADESACGEAQALRVLEHQAADVLVLKPSAAGGLRVALRIAERARAAGVGVLVTSLLDPAPGLVAATHLASALPGPLPASGLATAELLAFDLAHAPAPKHGQRGSTKNASSRGAVGSATASPGGPGLGLSLDPEALERARHGATLELRR